MVELEFAIVEFIIFSLRDTLHEKMDRFQNKEVAGKAFL